MSTHAELIASLSSDLRKVKPPANIELVAIAWCVASALYVVAVTHWFGPIRSNALLQLASEPRFFVETLLGTVAIAVTAVAAFRAAIPGALGPRLAGTAVSLMLLWLASYVFGLASPSLEPSMLGKRPHCVVESFIFGVPPLVLAYVLTRRLYPLKPTRTAMVLGLASGMLPALYMQIACMYAPAHILQFHIAPGLMVTLVGALLAWVGRARLSR